MVVKEIKTEQAPQAFGPYSQAVSIPSEGGEWVLVSGQVPLDPKTGELITSGILNSVNRVLDNIQAILAAAGLDWTHIVKTEIFLTDMANFPIINSEYQKRFALPPYPARQTIEVAGLPLGADVEISCWAFRRKK